MAVGRFYLQNSAAGYVPPTLRGGWDDTSGSNSFKMAKAKSGTITSYSKSEYTSIRKTYLHSRVISDALPYNKTIQGTLTYCLGMNESNAAADFYPQIHVYVTVGDTDVVRGTLLSQNRGVVELSTGTSSGILVTDLELSSVDALAGDRIVVEVGFYAANISSTKYTSLLYYGGTNATDLSAGASISTYTGWFEFSDDPMTDLAQALSLSGIPSSSAMGGINVLPGGAVLLLPGLPVAAIMGDLILLPGNTNLALAGISSGAQIGTLSMLPGEVSLSLFGVPPASQVGSIVLTSGSSEPVTLELSGIPPSSQVGLLELAPVPVSLELLGVQADNRFGKLTLTVLPKMARSPVYESILIDFLERNLELDLTERSLAINAEERLLILGVIGVPIIGDTIRLTAQFKNWTGELDDPSDVSVLVYDQNRNELATIAGASVINTETGKYYAEYVVPDVKMLIYEFTGILEGSVITQRKTLNPVWLGG